MVSAWCQLEVSIQCSKFFFSVNSNSKRRLWGGQCGGVRMQQCCAQYSCGGSLEYSNLMHHSTSTIMHNSRVRAIHIFTGVDMRVYMRQQRKQEARARQMAHLTSRLIMWNSQGRKQQWTAMYLILWKLLSLMLLQREILGIMDLSQAILSFAAQRIWQFKQVAVQVKLSSALIMQQGCPNPSKSNLVKVTQAQQCLRT